MNSFTLTAVGNLARNPELVPRTTAATRASAWWATTMRARTKRELPAKW